MNKYMEDVRDLISSHYALCFHKTSGWGARFGFYVWRLMNVPNYGLFQGRELVKMICRACTYDNELSFQEFQCLVNIIHDPKLDYILLEVNYNAGW